MKTAICPSCNQEFEVTRRRRRFCSRPCILAAGRKQMEKSLLQRFWDNLPDRPEDGCWIWQGGFCGPYPAMTRKHVRVHLFSYELHKGPIPDGLYVCHTCDTPACVNPAHLFLGTADQNSADMVKKGRSLKGSRSPASKLTEADVLAIRAAYAAGGITYRELGEQYGVTGTQIGTIVLRKSWKDLPP